MCGAIPLLWVPTGDGRGKRRRRRGHDDLQRRGERCRAALHAARERGRPERHNRVRLQTRYLTALSHEALWHHRHTLPMRDPETGTMLTAPAQKIFAHCEQNFQPSSRKLTSSAVNLKHSMTW